MKQKILPYGRQSIEQSDIDAVIDVLKADFLTTGPLVQEFEKHICAVTQSQNALVCSNGTTALHLAAEAIGLDSDSVAIVPSITFLATANAVRFTGAEVVFCDVDPETGLMTRDHLLEAIKRVPQGKKLKAVMPVHMKGIAVDLKDIRAIANQHDMKIIADSCHALGGKVYDKAIGSCFFEDISTFSFHPVKTIATGEGGAVTFNNLDYFDFVKTRRSHGMLHQPDVPYKHEFGFDENGIKNPWYYEMPDIGYNYRLTDIQCALGISQIKRIDKFLNRREEIASLYDELLSDCHPFIEIPARPSYCTPAWHLYAPRFNFERIRKSRAQFMHELREKSILTQVHYFPVHMQPYYQKRYGSISLPGAVSYYNSTLSLPLYPDLTNDDVARVVESLKSIIF